MANETPVHFFDINSNLPIPSKSWSPNTLRTRLVLNFKKIPYTQSFISYPDIAPLLKSASVPPLHGARVPYTLPAIAHPSSIGTSHGVLNDSWPIALHLEKTFQSPQHPTLFPSAGSYALALAVARVLNAILPPTRMILLPKIPQILDERGAEYFRRTRAEWFGRSLEEMLSDTEGVEKSWADVEVELKLLADMLRGPPGVNGGGKKKGPFFEGEQAGYADLLFAAFLAWYERGDRKDWERAVSIGDGEIRRFWDACLPWIHGQGEEKEYVFDKEG
ncbi:uncharacterized protein PADG_01071 [Paracoccidioides brasiliensis Pb18]|uniref:Uncharacterized protein n=1 Tax=Paracoccidioides brasiliensis (strain Pb18) TaxID=502780 RepID=C1FZ45_PARBD|nr:uncharacterized protein PADG_01071 [Paracoccidioides brasiliensis Pb18]EEH44782.1 hypothetical protein PADG_01071 [Paracoccidioides brasiliensis Pb18]